ncbi:MAG: ATP-binding protein, partial [Solirubrobacteraceae bacterium]|nr:ATP-binding protein [Patulibacter sp.]
IARVGAWSTELRGARSIDELVGFAARALRELTGYDRVWAYRFEPDGHGVVVAEERRADLEAFLGLHFPEGDIPAQARALYVRNGVRVIPDVAAQTAPLVPLENPETGAWLDLSGGSLRAVSPMHIRYLTNMGVRASMSVSLVVDGRLWGLLSAHHYDGPRRVDLATRGECELLGTLTSLQIAAATELERTRHRLELEQSVTLVMEAMATTESFAAGLVSDPDALLAVCRAAGAIVAIGDDRRLVGVTPAPADVDRLLDVLAAIDDDTIVTGELGVEHPAVADLADVAAGVIALPLSRRQGNWVVWLRPEHVHEVTWANRDKELVRRDPSGELELGERESFERWAEEVRGRARPWHAAEVDAVRSLRSALGGLLITRTDKLTRMNEELERSNDELDAFAYAAAHDLREPVRGIEQFAGFFLEDHGESLPEDGRDQIQTIRRLNGRMESLLTSLLEYAQIGQGVPTRKTVHLPTIVDEVRELLAARLDDDVTIRVGDTTVEADEAGLRQLLLNLVWNAIKYTPDDVSPEIEIGTVGLSEAENGVRRASRSIVSDEEPVAVFVRDNGIGIAREFHDQVFELFRRLHGRDEFGGGSGAGLTLGRRIVERHGGTIWVASERGEGATFFFTLGPA